MNQSPQVAAFRCHKLTLAAKPRTPRRECGTVPPEHRGQRLDRFPGSRLASGLSPTPHHVSYRRRGRERNLPHRAKANLTLQDGDPVRWTVPPRPRRCVGDEALPLEILYQDEDLAVLNKPAGLVVHPAAGHSPARW